MANDCKIQLSMLVKNHLSKSQRLKKQADSMQLFIYQIITINILVK